MEDLGIIIKVTYLESAGVMGIRCYFVVVLFCVCDIVRGLSVPDVGSGSRSPDTSRRESKSPDIPQYILDMYNVIADENGIRRKEAPDLGRTVTCIFSGR